MTKERTNERNEERESAKRLLVKAEAFLCLESRTLSRIRQRGGVAARNTVESC